MTYLDILEAQLAVDEGKMDRMYLDSEGIPTIGIGHNLRDVPLSARAMRVIFEDDTAQAIADAKRLVPMFDYLTEERKSVVCNMAFNLGYTRLSKFKNTLAAINEGRYADAAREMLDSTWAKQVGDRAKRLAAIMKGA